MFARGADCWRLARLIESNNDFTLRERDEGDFVSEVNAFLKSLRLIVAETSTDNAVKIIVVE